LAKGHGRETGSHQERAELFSKIPRVSRKLLGAAAQGKTDKAQGQSDNTGPGVAGLWAAAAWQLGGPRPPRGLPFFGSHSATDGPPVLRGQAEEPGGGCDQARGRFQQIPHLSQTGRTIFKARLFLPFLLPSFFSFVLSFFLL